MIEKKCKNCRSCFPSIEPCTLNSKMQKVCKGNNFRLFQASEQAIRKDEREKIIDALWLSITDNKKIIFEKDGHKFKLNLVPIINSEVE